MRGEARHDNRHALRCTLGTPQLHFLVVVMQQAKAYISILIGTKPLTTACQDCVRKAMPGQGHALTQQASPGWLGALVVSEVSSALTTMVLLYANDAAAVLPATLVTSGRGTVKYLCACVHGDIIKSAVLLGCCWGLAHGNPI